MSDYDFSLSDHGSIVLLHPLTFAARAWVEEHIDPDHQEWAGSVVIEPRYVLDIVRGIEADGLEVR